MPQKFELLSLTLIVKSFARKIGRIILMSTHEEDFLQLRLQDFLFSILNFSKSLPVMRFGEHMFSGNKELSKCSIKIKYKGQLHTAKRRHTIATLKKLAQGQTVFSVAAAIRHCLHLMHSFRNAQSLTVHTHTHTVAHLRHRRCTLKNLTKSGSHTYKRARE